jgi:alkylation response protein AidB-like acyl-CoA dehydrogenase
MAVCFGISPGQLEAAMDFGFTPAQERFREEVRGFLAARTPPCHWDHWDESAATQAFHRAMALELGARGWLGLTWPEKHGGAGRPAIEGVILAEELAYFGNPGINRPALGLVGPALLHFGTDAQRAEHLPGIVAGRSFWCQGFSEPEAGSDLAGLTTRAVADGEDFVVTGQKIWTSFAHEADWIFLLARTGPPGSRHRGISYLVADMRSPGITVRPIRHLTGAHTFNHVFFDALRVPRGNLVGQVDRGWEVAMGTLADERSGIEYAGASRRLLDDLLDVLRSGMQGRRAAEREAMRLAAARLAASVRACRMLAYRTAWLQAQGGDVSAEAAMSKVFGSELMERIARATMRALGRDGQLEPGEAAAPLGGRPGRDLFGGIGRITAAGTSEVMRNIIAQRGLGLPRPGR